MYSWICLAVLHPVVTQARNHYDEEEYEEGDAQPPILRIVAPPIVIQPADECVGPHDGCEKERGKHPTDPHRLFTPLVDSHRCHRKMVDQSWNEDHAKMRRL